MHLLREGNDLQALLAEVRAEHGEAAQIVRAERIRTGGVAGFFAKERYEVTIEIPDAEPGAPAASTGSSGSTGSTEAPARPLPTRTPTATAVAAAPAQPQVAPGFDDVSVAEMGRELARRLGTPVPSAPVSPAPATPAPASLGDLLAAADAADGADRLGAMISAGAGAPAAAQAVPAAFRAASVPAPRVEAPHRPISTEGESFAFTLASMRRHLADGTPADAPNVTPVVPSVMEHGASAQRERTAPAGGSEDLMSADNYGSNNGLSVPRETPVTGRNAERYEQDERFLAARRGHDYDEDFGGDRFGGQRAQSAPVEAPRVEAPRNEPQPVEAPRAESPRPEFRPEARRPEVRAPRPNRADSGDAGEAVRLAAEIAVPAPLTVGGGDVVVVIGEADAVVAAGLLVADETGSEAPVVIGRADVHATITLDELPALRQQARRYSAPLTVALPARPTGADAARAARLAAALDPAAVVVCVDATRRAHATGALLDALQAAGVPADRLAVHRAGESPDPLDSLSLDVPVGFLDGRPATTGAWAGLLLDAGAGRGRR
ncbi:hypothetical protein ACFFKU_11845 [Kineococcus gynurae]|uniref:Uncharacterized protein n=1 Tax=Kineococcus gynurae TaxID=452979 RepID=A0ABV5LR49_9ACTN